MTKEKRLQTNISMRGAGAEAKPRRGQTLTPVRPAPPKGRPALTATKKKVLVLIRTLKNSILDDFENLQKQHILVIMVIMAISKICKFFKKLILGCFLERLAIQFPGRSP